MIKIFQIDLRKDNNDVAFMSYSWIKKFDFSIYEEVWSGEIPGKYKTLDGIFTMFNMYRPDDFHGHSLSVSDIVQTIDEPEIENGYYYCNSIGWKRLEI